MLGLNKLRYKIPNFMCTYGVFYYHTPIVQDENNYKMYHNNGKCAYLVMENINNSKSFRDKKIGLHSIYVSMPDTSTSDVLKLKNLLKEWDALNENSNGRHKEIMTSEQVMERESNIATKKQLQIKLNTLLNDKKTIDTNLREKESQLKEFVGLKNGRGERGESGGISGRPRRGGISGRGGRGRRGGHSGGSQKLLPKPKHAGIVKKSKHVK
jgi:hypothetical protein